jgi:hypothetical protein
MAFSMCDLIGVTSGAMHEAGEWSAFRNSVAL